MNTIESFHEYRRRMNERMLGSDSLIIKRLMRLDSQAYEARGGLCAKTKELLGLSASLVLRCDDCIKYHIGQALEKGASQQEILETFEIGYIVGGSVVIPHLRRAFEYLDTLIAAQNH
jgi:AhpD family alkylhydroperoxidase